MDRYLLVFGLVVSDGGGGRISVGISVHSALCFLNTAIAKKVAETRGLPPKQKTIGEVLKKKC